MQILKRYFKKKNPSGRTKKEDKITKEDDEVPTGPSKTKVEPDLFNRVNESLSNGVLRDFVHNRKASKISSESSFQGKKIVFEQPIFQAKKLVAI